jgi:histidinol-phosphate/aromatic aminotransferase/cobyric acid decarboxylase-like protein
LAVETTLSVGDSALLPAPSFGEYAREVRLQGADPTFVAHDEILDADPTGHELAVLCLPNNPTGEAYDPAAVRSFVRRCNDVDATPLIDETLLDVTDLDTFAGTPGVVVVRGLTDQYGIPGLRAGLLVATGDLRDAIDAGRPAWTVSIPAASVATHCLQRPEFLAETRDRLAEERAYLRGRLVESYGVFDSDAPFLLLDVRDRSVSEVVDHARERGVVVRDATGFRRLDNHVRVAVKRRHENEQLLAALPGVSP